MAAAKTTTTAKKIGLKKRASATTTKGKSKIVKDEPNDAVEKEINTYRCLRCGTEFHKLEGNFRKYKGKIWTGWYEFDKNNKPVFYLPICRECLNGLFGQLTRSYFGDEKKAMKRLCATLDIGYSDKLFNATNKAVRDSSQNDRIAKWFQAMGLDQYPATCDDYFETILYTDLVAHGDEEAVGEELKLKFGDGYENEEYKILERNYQEWKNDCGDDTTAKKQLIIRLCFLQLQIHKRQLNGEPTKDLDKTFQDTLAALNLQPKQSKLDGDIVSKYTLGELLANFEQDEPVIDKDDEFEDVDGIQEYIDVFFKGGLAAGMGLKGNMFTTLYHKVMDTFTAKKRTEEEDHELQKLNHAIFGDEED